MPENEIANTILQTSPCLKQSEAGRDVGDIPNICQPTLAGYKWALTGIEETIIEDGFTLRLGIASLLLKRSIAARVEKLHTEIAGIDVVSLGTDKRLRVLARRLEVWMRAIQKPWPYWKTLVSVSPTILTYVWIHAIRDATWRDQAFTWWPVAVTFNCILLYFPFFEGWVLSRLALAGVGAKTAIAEKATFGSLEISIPSDPPLHLYAYWLGMLGINAAFTWISSGRMVGAMLAAQGTATMPIKLANGSELADPSHFWQIFSVQVIWTIVAILGFIYIKRLGSDERAVSVALEVGIPKVST